MDTPNAVGFIGVSLIMQALHLVPGGTAVRELWLWMMGGVLLAIGMAVVAKAAWLQLAPQFEVLWQAVARRRAADEVDGSAVAADRATV